MGRFYFGDLPPKWVNIQSALTPARKRNVSRGGGDWRRNHGLSGVLIQNLNPGHIGDKASRGWVSS